MAALTFRRAPAGDLDELLGLERNFPGDRLSRRSFRRFLTGKTAEVWVCARQDKILGNAVVLYRRGSKSARLYSIVVAASARGRGIAARLMQTVEEAALRRRCRRMYLEVRVDNKSAIALYEKLGYVTTRLIPKFYEDSKDALRLERNLQTRQRLAA